MGEALQSAVYDKGFNWTVGSTSVSALSDEEQKAHLGLHVDPSELRATEAAIAAFESVPTFSAVGAPPAVDWRNKNGNWTTPVQDQASCGSCVSFATIATIESRVKIACNNAGLTPDYSEAFLFYCGCGNCCPSGWNFSPALNFCQTTGVCRNSDFPYTPGNQPCPAGLTPQFKITGWNAILPVADRKNILATKGPLVAGMAVYGDFYSYQSGVYKHVSGELKGYHAVSCVGYDDAQQCWICKNSWGTNWGEAGYFRIGYGEAQMDTSFAMYNVEAPCQTPTPSPTDACTAYLAVLRSVLVAAQTNRSLRLCLRHYVCGRGRRPLCSPQIMRVVNGVLRIMRECPRYREPFCRALG
jgi:C1A family cysteine protease